jgi:hypothetical protein
MTKLCPPEEVESELPQGVFRWTSDGADWARVHIRLGEWIDLPKAEYDAQKIEPTFWALQEKDSWREGVGGLS